MKSYIGEIEQILKGGDDILTYENLPTSFIMNSPALAENITKCDIFCEHRLPKEYKYFLEYYDGGTLFKYEDIGGYKFLSTKEIIEVNELQIKTYEEYWDGSIIFFCELLGNGEYLGFKTTETSVYRIVHSMMAAKPEEWSVIEDSFDTLIEMIIKEKGKEYWFFPPYDRRSV